MKRLIAKSAEFLPGEWPLRFLDAARRLRYPRLRREHREQTELYRRCGSPRQVLQGPFKGMHYLSRAYFGPILPKVLGTHEMELWPAVERLCALSPPLIIDIGAAEGYYAVGLAMRNPASRVICYEMYAPARRLIGQMARMNGVESRVTILPTCTVESLRKVLEDGKPSAIVCDVEGAEDELMDPGQIPALKHCVLLIEVHEGFRQALPERMKSRFAQSHELEHIHNRPRIPADIPPGISLTARELDPATYEGRRVAQWFFLTPRRT